MGQPQEQPQKNQYVIITGASRGIGAAIAERILADDPNLKVISLARSTHDKIKVTLDEETFPHIHSDDRFMHKDGIDLADEEKNARLGLLDLYIVY